MIKFLLTGFLHSVRDKRTVHTPLQAFWFYIRVLIYVILPFVYLGFIIYYISHVGAELDYGISMTIAITFLLLSWLMLYLIYRSITIFYYGPRLYKVTAKMFRIFTLLILFLVFILPVSFILTIVYFIT